MDTCTFLWKIYYLGLKELKVNKNQVDIKVLDSDDKRSFFSILAPRIVKVELTVKENGLKENNSHEKDNKPKEIKTYTEDELNKAESNVDVFLKEFLSKIGNDVKYSIKKDETGLFVTINGQEAGYLIGYRHCFEFLRSELEEYKKWLRRCFMY